MQQVGACLFQSAALENVNSFGIKTTQIGTKILTKQAIEIDGSSI